MGKKVVIVGGVAGGMSCAARIKRLDASARVVVIEKGPNVSFANCGMPYYIGGVIQDRDAMVVAAPEMLQNRYGLDIRTRQEVVRLDTAAKKVEVRNLADRSVYTEEYDTLVLATGAEPIMLPVPGADLPHVMTLNNLDDMDRIAAAAKGARNVCVIGGGFIGLELAENLRHLGLAVSVVEVLDQVMGPLDKEITAPLLQELRLNGVDVHLENAVESVAPGSVTLRDGKTLPADLVCMCAGVRPRSGLAKEAGIPLGPRGHIVVDGGMRTGAPDVYAVGDAVEVVDAVMGGQVAIPLAGPANRQGRVAADVICGRESVYPGVQGSSIVKVFNLAAASTGWSEKRLKAAGIPHRRAYVHPMQHARYYPGAQPVGMKLLFSPEGKIYGAQVVGPDGVEVAVDVLATAMRGGLTVYDLEQLELAYSPQWGAAKHGINMLGFVAANILRGDVDAVEADNLPVDAFLLDVRAPDEMMAGALPGAVNIPVDELAGRMGEVPTDRPVVAYCAVGLRGYVAARMLVQNGVRACNLNGGFRTWCWFNPPASATVSGGACCAPGAQCSGEAPKKENKVETQANMVKLDVCGLQCPGPLSQVGKRMGELAAGDLLEVVSTDPGFAADVPAWCSRTGNELVSVRSGGGRYVALIRKNAATAVAASCCGPVAGAPSAPTASGKTIVCFSGDLDRVLAAFVIANGAAAMGDKVTIFFTFWGLNALRKDSSPPVPKPFMDKMFGWMMPKGANKLTLSKMNMGGMGTVMMKQVMKNKRVQSLPELIDSARAAGVRLVACSMSMDVMGLRLEELMDGIEVGGVGAFLGAANESNASLFI